MDRMNIHDLTKDLWAMHNTDGVSLSDFDGCVREWLNRKAREISDCYNVADDLIGSHLDLSKPSPAPRDLHQTWCEHWEYRGGGEWKYEGSFDRHGYTVKPPNFCPDCAAPRPAEKPRTLEEVLEHEAKKRLPKEITDKLAYEGVFEAQAKASNEHFREKVESLPETANGFIEKKPLLRAIEKPND